MKKNLVIALSMLVMICLGAGSALAANSLKQNSFGFSVNAVNVDPDTDGSIISGRFFVLDNLAIIAGLGLNVRGADDEGTDIGLMAGARYYLTTDDFAPFAGGRLEYHQLNDGDLHAYRLAAEFGAEYFLSRQFSVEGSVGLGFTFIDYGKALGDTEATRFGTTSSAIRLNFYF